jgi:hypothetical protein
MRPQQPFTAATATLLLLVIGVPVTAPGSGPLRVSSQNPRYFTDADVKHVYLTGAHTWNNLQDMGTSDPPPAFHFEEYLDFLQQRHHNFIRLCPALAWAFLLSRLHGRH